MNYYPYLNALPAALPSVKTGLLKTLTGGLNWGSIINGTQRTLGLINQAIPIIKQAKPVFTNAKTMFKVMNEFKKVEVPVVNTSVNKNVNTTTNNTSESISSGSGLTFFQ